MCALLHEKSYPRVGFFSLFFPRMEGPEHRSPKLHVCVSGRGKGLLFAIGRVRFLVKSTFFADSLLAGGRTPLDLALHVSLLDTDCFH